LSLKPGDPLGEETLGAGEEEAERGERGRERAGARRRAGEERTFN